MPVVPVGSGDASDARSAAASLDGSGVASADGVTTGDVVVVAVSDAAVFGAVVHPASTVHPVSRAASAAVLEVLTDPPSQDDPVLRTRSASLAPTG